MLGQFPKYCETIVENSIHEKCEKPLANEDQKLKQLSNLLDFAIMAEGFENLLNGKKTDSLLIEAINDTT